VLAQWQMQDGRYVPAPLGPNLAARRGVRRADGQLQMGLTSMEIQAIQRLLERLLQRVDKGEITALPAPEKTP
jgi:hypothetical protein